MERYNEYKVRQIVLDTLYSFLDRGDIDLEQL